MDDDFPAIIVHRSTMRVIDGMHRLRAARVRAASHIKVQFFDGRDEDAFVLAVESNSKHGLPLTQIDRTAAAARIIDTHPQWSNRVIASLTGLADTTVAAMRQRSTANEPQSNRRIGKDGRSRPVNAAEGRRRASDLIAQNPNASLREIAAAAGIAVGTARDVRERMRAGTDPVPVRLRQAEQGKPSNGHRKSIDKEQSPPSGTKSAAGSTLHNLKKDPSLRMTEVGRTLLRLLDIHSIDPEAWKRLASGIPAHCNNAVAQAARRCAENWENFAQFIESETCDRY
ncbi:hypothetical protein [Amycolatopsis aidingensis]|uniref:hypothetical protein n=1 Tax=Amycolatopsis aidingensis TaxID=2842453 RepID=UPI001E621E7E|nr:hypothetical protein [Amycolatopsis aidingensis]